MLNFALSLHAHFYQPPRLNPLTGKIGSERGAAPYRNWNERAAEEVYRPNAKRGNFATLSVDIGQFLLEWLEEHDPQTYQTVIKSVRSSQGSGNLLAAPYCQAPLTSLSPQDRLVMLRWGAASAKARFGYDPQGVFLPNFAADNRTLEAVVAAGYKFTLLRSSQVTGLAQGASGLHRLRLENGAELAVYIINEQLSQTMLNEMVERGGAGYWSHRFLLPHIHISDPMTMLYIDGELLGQHHMCEADFIYHLLRTEARAMGFKPVNLTDYYLAHHNTASFVELVPSPTESLSGTQTLLTLALNALLEASDHLLRVIKGSVSWLMEDATLAQLTQPRDPLLKSYLLLRQAWTNCLDLERYPQIGITNILGQTAYAIQLLSQETGTDLTATFRNRLAPQFTKLFDDIAVGLAQQTEPANAAV